MSESFIAAISTASIPNIFDKFKEIIDESIWIKRAKNIDAVVKGNSLLQDVLAKDNVVAYGLASLSKICASGRRLPTSFSEREWAEYYPAITIAAQVLKLISIVEPKIAARIKSRFYGALKNPDDMRGLMLEFASATHFVQLGYSVEFPELGGIGNGDIFLPDIGTSGLSIECKSISSDKGKKIHTYEVCEFYKLISKELPGKFRNAFNFGIAIVVTIHGRMPANFSSRQKIASECARIAMGKSNDFESDIASIKAIPFDPKLITILDDGVKKLDARKEIDQLTGTENRNAMILGTPAGGRIIMLVQSDQDDSVITTIFDTLSDSAERQLEKDIPGMFVVGFNGISSESLQKFATKDIEGNSKGSALRLAVTDFLNSEKRNHIVGVNFTSRNAMTFSRDGVVSGGGSAYAFPKRESPLWHVDFEKLYEGYRF